MDYFLVFSRKRFFVNLSGFNSPPLGALNAYGIPSCFAAGKDFLAGAVGIRGR